MSRTALSDDEITAYHQHGFYVARRLFTEHEIALLHRTAKEDYELDRRSYTRADGEGGQVRLSLWNHPGDNIYGAYARCERLVRSAERLLDDEVYHYHSKMIMKDAKVGGAFTWHQDYGYWYKNGILTPNLTSVMIAVDRATKENGCLQVIDGSHRCGRLEHRLTGEQAGADLERVQQILKRMSLVYIEMEPGDALFFHPNLLHRSDPNYSDYSRWAMICCYNAKSNDPYHDSHHPRYTPLHVLPDTATIEMGAKSFATSSSSDDPATSNDASWLHHENDHSAKE